MRPNNYQYDLLAHIFASERGAAAAESEEGSAGRLDSRSLDPVFFFLLL